MPVQPIRLFGDPVLRTPAVPVTDFDKELRRLVVGPDRHHARGTRRRAGRAADRGRPPGLHLARRRRARAPGQPGARPVRGGAVRPRGLPVAARPRPSTAPGRCGVVAKGFDMHGEPVTIEGTDLLARCDPARDRPPRRGAVPRPARPGDPAGGDEGDPRVGLVRRGPDRRPHLQGLARTRPAASASDAGGVRRHPGAGAARARGRRGQPRTRWSAWSPARTPPPDAAARWSRSPVAQRAERARRPGAQAGHAPGPGLPGGAARPRAGLLPGGGLRRAAAAERARHPAARLGEPALLAAAGLARRGPGAARAVLPATSSPARPRSGSCRAGHRPGLRA